MITSTRQKQERVVGNLLVTMPITRNGAVTLRGKAVWRVTAHTWNVNGKTLFLAEAIAEVLR